MGMNKPLSVLFVAAEAAPFAKVGGLADVAAGLPAALRKMGVDARVAVPCYRMAWSCPGLKIKDGPSGKLNLLGNEYPFSVKTADVNGLPVYLIDLPQFFNRDMIYCYFDDPERFIAFCRGTIESLRALDWQPDVIHCNDWQTGLIPAMLATGYKDSFFTKKIPTVFTIHNLAYQGTFPDRYMEAAGLPGSEFVPDRLEFYGKMNFLKGGIFHADHITTVSRTYAREILTPEYGERLDGMLRHYEYKLSGIVNGIDTGEFNPEKDPALAANFSAATPEKKKENKYALLEELGLPAGSRDKGAPLIGMVTRIAWQKGFDLIVEALREILKMNLKLVILGCGDPAMEKTLRDAAAGNPKKMAMASCFDEPFARRFYAGSDIFLMPSRFEPCGLGQMIAMRYGAVPLVRATGGLADTVEQFDARTGEGDGFVFSDCTSDAMLESLRAAVSTYREKKQWKQLVANCMARDFSWDGPAAEYAEIYRKLHHNV